MKAAFINFDDYSNFSYNLSQSLKSVGIDSIALKLIDHKFDYKEQAYVVNHTNMFQQIEDADVVVVGHSEPSLLNLIPEGKRVWVIHTGTRYRQNPELSNSIFNPIVERTFIDSPEFYTLGAKNVTYVAAGVDTDKIKFTESNSTSLTFAHYPSKASTKGTAKIKEMMNDFTCVFNCDERILTHEKNLARMGTCDVYIELFSPTQKEKAYGSFGVTAFEAAAMGKIVVTNSLYHDVYNQAYGTSELEIANCERGFRYTINDLMQKSKGEIMIKQMMTREWIVNKHSMTATGNYLAKFL
jgi:hypothetical protein